MSQVWIQAQDTSGQWRTYNTTMNDPQLILRAMQGLKDQLPNYRVRAVDDQGRLVDILG